MQFAWVKRPGDYKALEKAAMARTELAGIERALKDIKKLDKGSSSLCRTVIELDGRFNPLRERSKWTSSEVSSSC